MAICHLSTLLDGKSDVFRVPDAYDQHVLTRGEKVQPCDAPIMKSMKVLHIYDAISGSPRWK